MKLNSGKASIAVFILALLLGAFFIGESISKPTLVSATQCKSLNANCDNASDHSCCSGLSCQSAPGGYKCLTTPPSDSVSITHKDFSCGSQSLDISGTATYSSTNRELEVWLDGTGNSHRILDTTSRPANWDAGNHTLGVGSHTVYAETSSTISGDKKADDTWTFTINACPTRVDGECGDTQNTCKAGTPNDIADSGTQYLWQCVGQNEGTTASCSLDIPVNCPANSSLNENRQCVCNTGYHKVGEDKDDFTCQADPTTPPVVDLCTNIDGIQTTVPDGLHINSTGHECEAWSNAGPPVRTDEGTGTPAVLGASTTHGQVLGASTMAKTGGFEEMAYQAIMVAGATLSAFGIKNFKKASKKA